MELKLTHRGSNSSDTLSICNTSTVVIELLCY